MTYEQFYDGPCDLAVSYKKAHYIRRDMANFDAYLIGTYFYDAIQRNAPIFNPFIKDKVKPWLDKPYELGRAGEGDSEGNIRHGENKSAAVSFMESFMARHNAKMNAMERESAD